MISKRVMLFYSDVHSSVELCVLPKLLRCMCDYTFILWQLLINIVFCACYLLHRVVHSKPES
jgi:hypothetical protein